MLKKGLRRMLSLALVFVMVLGLCGLGELGEVKAAGEVVFAVNADKQTVQRGDQFTVTVSMTGNTSGESLGFFLQYEGDKLELVDSSNAQMGDSTNMNPASNPIKLGAIRDGKPLSDGVFITLKFKVKEDAAPGALGFTATIDEFADADGNDVAASVADNASNVKIVVPVTGISLDRQTLELAKGASQKLNAVLAPEGAAAAVAWTSSNAAAASVTEDGTVTANAAGKAVITASAEGKTASCTVNVTIPLNGISIQGEGDLHTIKKGQTLKLSVSYDPQDTTVDKSVTWTSSNPSAATVDRNGLVTAIADGQTTITAEAGGKTAQYAVTVEEVPLVSISLNKSTATIHRGSSEVLTVTYNPSNTTDDRTVQWTSSDSSKVQVDGSGKVTAVAVGGAKITASAGGKTAECDVSVDAPLEGIIPNKTSIDMIKNQKADITWILEPADTTDSSAVTAASSAADVAAVTNTDTGKCEITAKKAGSAVITLTGANGVTAAVQVNVTEIPINAVVLSSIREVVEKDDTVKLTASIGPADTTDDDKTITWSSSDTSVASVSPSKTNSGDEVTVTAAGGGKAVITAAAANGTKAECEIVVPIHMTGISLPAAAEINRNSTKTLAVTYIPQNTTDGKKLRWTSSDPDTASVDPDTGVITAKKEGTVTITAATTETSAPLTAQTQVTIKEYHLDTALGDTIEFEPMQAPVLRGQQYNMYHQMNLADIIKDNGITDDITIKWSSSDEDVAAVDQSGNVIGRKKGKAVITAVITAADGEGNETGIYTVETEVEIKEIPLESIAFNKVITEMQVGATDVLGIIYNPNDTTDVRDVVWSSSDAGVLSVENGRLTARKAGTAEITAKVGDKSVTCKITVKDTDGSAAGGRRNTGRRAGVSTGDTADIALYLVLLLLSAAALAICYVRKSRRISRHR